MTGGRFHELIWFSTDKCVHSQPRGSSGPLGATQRVAVATLQKNQNFISYSNFEAKMIVFLHTYIKS